MPILQLHLLPPARRWNAETTALDAFLLTGLPAFPVQWLPPAISNSALRKSRQKVLEGITRAGTGLVAAGGPMALPG